VKATTRHVLNLVLYLVWRLVPHQVGANR